MAAVHFSIELDIVIFLDWKNKILKNGLIFPKMIGRVRMKVLIKSNRDSAIGDPAPA